MCVGGGSKVNSLGVLERSGGGKGTMEIAWGCVLEGSWRRGIYSWLSPNIR